MAMALELLFGIPLALGYLISSVAIIPLVTHGITFISRFQLWSQPLWIILQVLPFAFIIYSDASTVKDWTQFTGIFETRTNHYEGFNILLFGAASAVIFSLIAQIGEQVDFLRFLPTPKPDKKWQWWAAMLAGGPGWIFIGAIKILAGSFLAVLAINHGVGIAEAADPTRMYMIAFGYITHSPEIALSVAGIFVILSQLKINVTNAYAGSIAWSNFFSRLTHSHPGRVVWLVFNVAIALLLMELGVYRALEQTLGFYGIVAVAWLGALVADLVINKPLGLSPKHIEFKRANLYDINPVGFGSMLIATLIGVLCHGKFFGEIAQALSHFIALTIAMACAPAIAIATKSRYYLARPLVVTEEHLHEYSTQTCCICEHKFEHEDMTYCPAYAGNICSLCCSLDARCQDYCKPGASYTSQLVDWLKVFLPQKITSRINPQIGHFLFLVVTINGVSAILLSLIYFQTTSYSQETSALLEATLWKVFFLLVIITGVVSWLFVLAHDSRLVAQEESQRQTRLLMEEIDAHELTDKELQKAKEQADAANLAKSRYLTGISHELRSPLNAVLGYAQLLEKDQEMPAHRKEALSVIRRSGEYLADLIEGLLDISKIEVGKLELHQDQVRISVLIDQLVHMFRFQAEAKGLEFIFECNDRLPEFVKTDEKRLRQILINLLSNAIKYTERGSVSFKVRYRSEVAEFTVSDTGEGIAAENMERIFKPFERLRRPGSTATGTGLGLTITRLLCEIMGGEISVQSEAGKGSSFKACLMLASIAKPLNEFVAEPTQTIYGYKGAVRTLMLVDDDSSHRQLMRALLSPLGFNVIDVNNSLAVIPLIQQAQLQNDVPDLLLLDVSMPGMDGWELTRELRAMEFQSPIVMVSADASEGKDQPFFRNTEISPLHDAYVVKPVRIPILLDHIGRLLNLIWCYEKFVSKASLVEEQLADANQRIDAVQIPDDKHLDDLAHLASIGHRKGLLEKIHELEINELASKNLIHQLKFLISNFQFEKIIELIDAKSTAEHE